MKKELREKNKELRKKLPVLELSKRIKENLFNSLLYRNAKNIFCYYSFRDEVDTVSYFLDDSKNWFIPKVDGMNMLVCPYSKNNIVQNKYGIFESNTPPITDFSIIDLVILPALAVDKKGYRIGYGKGFYDRFFFNNDIKAIKIVPIFSNLIVEDTFPEKFDVPCDYLISEKGIVKF